MLKEIFSPACILFVLLLSSSPLSSEVPFAGGLEEVSRLHATKVEQKIEPMRETIDPDRYILGPMDEITVRVWKEPFETYVSLVNAEGLLVFEGIGSIEASGKKLSAVRGDIEGLFSSKFRENVTITSSLSGIRPILVDVLGAVRAPGRSAEDDVCEQA